MQNQEIKNFVMFDFENQCYSCGLTNANAQNGETNLFCPQRLLVADVAAKATGGEKFNCDNVIHNV